MPGTTPSGAPYPTGTDKVKDGAAKIQQLAEWADSLVGIHRRAECAAGPSVTASGPLPFGDLSENVASTFSRGTAYGVANGKLTFNEDGLYSITAWITKASAVHAVEATLENADGSLPSNFRIDSRDDTTQVGVTLHGIVRVTAGQYFTVQSDTAGSAARLAAVLVRREAL